MGEEKLEDFIDKLNETTDEKFGIHFTYQIFGDKIVILPDYINGEYVGEAFECW